MSYLVNIWSCALNAWIQNQATYHPFPINYSRKSWTDVLTYMKAAKGAV